MFTAVEEDGGDKRLVELGLACRADGVAPADHCHYGKSQKLLVYKTECLIFPDFAINVICMVAEMFSSDYL